MNPITLNELTDLLAYKRKEFEILTKLPSKRFYVSRHIIRSVAHEISDACTHTTQSYCNDLSEPVLKIHGFPVFQVIEENHIEVA